MSQMTCGATMCRNVTRQCRMFIRTETTWLCKKTCIIGRHKSGYVWFIVHSSRLWNLKIFWTLMLKLKFWMDFIITETIVLQSFTYLIPWNLTQKPVFSNLGKFCSLFGIWIFCYYMCSGMITSANRRIIIQSQMNLVHSCTSQFV